jgi:hypothetical protein
MVVLLCRNKFYLSHPEAALIAITLPSMDLKTIGIYYIRKKELETHWSYEFSEVVFNSSGHVKELVQRLPWIKKGHSSSSKRLLLAGGVSLYVLCSNKRIR